MLDHVLKTVEHVLKNIKKDQVYIDSMQFVLMK